VNATDAVEVTGGFEAGMKNIKSSLEFRFLPSWKNGEIFACHLKISSS
jgi:hypothetical protein